MPLELSTTESISAVLLSELSIQNPEILRMMCLRNQDGHAIGALEDHSWTDFSLKMEVLTLSSVNKNTFALNSLCRSNLI